MDNLRENHYSTIRLPEHFLSTKISPIEAFRQTFILPATNKNQQRTLQKRYNWCLPSALLQAVPTTGMAKCTSFLHRMTTKIVWQWLTASGHNNLAFLPLVWDGVNDKLDIKKLRFDQTDDLECNGCKRY